MAVRGLLLTAALGALTLFVPTASAAIEPSLFSRAWRLISLQDHNTRVVIIGAGLLGVACGAVGTFMLLRRRALVADALSHATLPGVATAFLVMVLLGGSGKALGGLLLGALVFGLLGVGGVMLIRHHTRLKEDAALAIVLSVFFGLGMSLLGVIQRMPEGGQAGLQSYIYGKAASMQSADAIVIAIATAVVLALCLLLYKEMKLICFDQNYAGAQGWPVAALDLTLMTLVAAVTVIGLQAVGLILIIALLIIPPAAARFWTDRLSRMTMIAALIGGLSGVVGVGVSALGRDLPTGALIVLTAAVGFGVSMIFGPARGVLARVRMHRTLSRTVAKQHLLRAIYEICEAGVCDVGFDELLCRRSWSTAKLRRTLRIARRGELLTMTPGGRYRLTPVGRREAHRVVRNHRLWELFLIQYADVAPSQVDRGADHIEHVLDADVLEHLEELLQQTHPELSLPASPHPMPEGGV